MTTVQKLVLAFVVLDLIVIISLMIMYPFVLVLISIIACNDIKG